MMRTLTAAVLSLMCLTAQAGVLIVPQVLSCPAPLWPATCPTASYQPLTTTGQAVASQSKTTPKWEHTFAGYPSTAVLVICPVGATLSDDHKACTNAAGTDASVMAPKSAIAAPVPPPVPVMAAYTITSVSSPDLTTTFTQLNALDGQCFVISSGTRKLTACMPPLQP